MKNIKRKGFTLVELLIVIVVIGILSAMMMLSSTEAVTSARASNIVSNLRNFKTAALAMYVDKLDEAANLTDGLYSGNTTTPTVSMDVVVKYMNNASTSASASDADMKKYGIHKNADDGWFVYYDFTGNNGTFDSRIASKLAGRASSVGLVGGADTDKLTQSGNTYKGNTGDNIVGMWVVKP